MRTRSIRHAAPAVLIAAGLALPALAQDAGQLDKESAERVHPSKPHYSPYAGRNFPPRAGPPSTRSITA